jgi:tripartite-type tricarboxylate transporter receptor subunit TctC
VIVDNRGAGIIPGDVVAKSAPDGYTLLAYGQPLWLSALMQGAPYDPVRDFAPITLATRAPNVLVVHPSLPVKSVKELIALAKAKPGELNYASPAIGGSAHLAAELFNSMAGVKIVRVNYKSAGAGITDLIGGHVQLTFGTAASVTPAAKSGRLRALAVTSAEPSPLAPGLPSIAQSGLAGYEMVAVVGIFAPAKMPEPIIRRLNQETVRVLNQPEVKDKCFSTGVESVGSTPEHLGTMVKTEMTRLGKVIKDVGIRAE